VNKKRSEYLRRPDRAVAALVRAWSGIPLSIRAVNFLFQRVFRLNADVPYSVHFTSRVIVGKGITIGRNVWKSFALSGGCLIQGGNGISIGDDTIFAPGVKIISANHDPGNAMKWKPQPSVKIGRGCWLGANAVVLPGVELGDHVVVGAGAVVATSFPSPATVVGVPARQVAGQDGCASP